MGLLHYCLYLAIIGAGFLTGWRRLWKKATIRPVIVLLGLTTCSEVLSKVLAHTVHNNLPVYHVYHPVQILSWSVFFYRNLRTGWRRTVVPLAACILLFAAINTTFLQPLYTFPANLIKVESVILLFWSFCLFWEFLDRPASQNILLQSSFLICVALLWFNLVSYLFFELYNYYVTSAGLLRSVWRIHLFSNYTYYSLLLAAMFLKADPTTHE